jgi:AP-1 complex subunit beta-1
LKQDLDSNDLSAKKDALKKVIASMTVGKDVSVLFFDVVKNIQTTDLELKKLVYLYVMNYAKTQPDLAILSVNAFVQVIPFTLTSQSISYLFKILISQKDSTRNPNPLIRALAIRTMGCIRVEKITEYLAQPLHQCLKVCFIFSNQI